jgi:hypothetical protein
VTRRVYIRCGHCRRLIRPASISPEHGFQIEGAMAPEGSLITASTPGQKRAARWWDQSPDGWNLDRTPTRYGYDCEGKHRGTRGTIGHALLEQLCRDAQARGEHSIYLT